MPETSAASVIAADTTGATGPARGVAVGTTAPQTAPGPAAEAVSRAVEEMAPNPRISTPAGEPAPTGLQIRLGPDDLAGPLWWTSWTGDPLQALETTYQITDQCERRDLLKTLGSAGALGQLLPEFGMTSWSRDLVEQDIENCSWRRFLAQGQGPAHYGHSSAAKYFWTREDARAWLLELRHSAASRTTLYPDTMVLGFTETHSFGWHEPFGIVFSEWDTPVDEVRVLRDSIAVRGGALRGLVRNWSRHLWAYEVTVTAEGRSFRWPLSVQPGEVAPFEIPGWDGSEDPAQIQASVSAEMSWHADPSRAFDLLDSFFLTVGEPSQAVGHSSAQYRNPEVTADQVGIAELYGTLSADFVHLEMPLSHPSVAAALSDLVVHDLRAFGIVFDAAGRVVDVVPATLEIRHFTYSDTVDENSDTTEEEFIVRSSEVRSWPLPEPDQLRVAFDVSQVHAEAAGSGYDELENPYAADSVIEVRPDGSGVRGLFPGGFILWVGAAFPSRPAG